MLYVLKPFQHQNSVISSWADSHVEGWKFSSIFKNWPHPRLQGATDGLVKPKLKDRASPWNCMNFRTLTWLCAWEDFGVIENGLLEYTLNMEQMYKESHNYCGAHHATRLNTPIHNILSTAPQLSMSQKTLGTLPEDGNVMPKNVRATIHN
jgi:hypothetical protein